MTRECVILLHGLARTARSMQTMAAAFTADGYHVVNVDYPSRKHPVEQLAVLAVAAGLKACANNTPIHFVTHSLGGILVRHYLQQHALPQLGRVVMLAPPNHGSGVVDVLRKVPGFAWFNGPAGLQLGTDANSVPCQLPPVEFPVGIIAGTATFNLILSLFLPDPNDGKVSVESTKVQGMQDFLSVPYSHPFLMRRAEVIAQTLQFIRTGTFKH